MRKVTALKGLKRATKELAKGRYHSVDHRITEYHDGDIKHGWSTYIDGEDWTRDYDSPEKALEEMKLVLKK